jgi:hypothetical protein
MPVTKVPFALDLPQTPVLRDGMQRNICELVLNRRGNNTIKEQQRYGKRETKT